MDRNGWILALGAIVLGLTGLAFRDFGLQWQPAPEGLPFRGTVAVIAASVLVIGGVMLIWRRTASYGAWTLAAAFLAWTLINAPRAFADPLDAADWLGFCENLAIAVGAATLAFMASRTLDVRRMTAARVFFGLCALVFGLSHFQYAAFTASMVPDWIPFSLFWAYATGAGHFAAGLALISGVQARLAVMLHAAMCASFVVLLHIPQTIANPADHREWVMTGMSLSLTGAAFALWRALSRRSV